MGKRGQDEMTRAIDVLAKAMPNGQLMAALGPLAFLGSAAEHIKALVEELQIARAALTASQAEVARLTAELAAETRQHADTLTRYDEACDTLTVSQAEVSALKDKNDACCAEIARLAADKTYAAGLLARAGGEIERLRAGASRLQGGRERAYFKGAENAAASLERARSVLHEWQDALRVHREGWSNVALDKFIVLSAKTAAFLATPPTPIATLGTTPAKSDLDEAVDLVDEILAQEVEDCGDYETWRQRALLLVARLRPNHATPGRPNQ